MSQQPVDTHHIYGLFVLFLITGGIAAFAPEPSAFWGWVLLGNFIISGIWSGIGYYKQLDRRPKWRIFYSIVHLDLFSGYAAVIAWRGNGETFLGALFFFVPMILAGWIGHRYRRRVLSEALEPRSWVTRILWIVATGAGGGALAGMALGKTFPQVALIWMYLVALLFVLFGHSIWIKAEDPDFEPHQDEQAS